MGIFPEDRPKPKGLLDAILNVGAGLARDVPRAANWWVESMKKRPEAAQQDVLDTIGGAAESFATLPKRAFGASETMRTEGTYNPEPIVEAATLPMGTGAIAGVPIKAGEVALGAGILRPKPVIGGTTIGELPPMTGGYHATVARENFKRFRKSDIDQGTHLTTDPDVSVQYALGTTTGDFGGLTQGARTIPVVADIRNPLKYPSDPVNWSNPQWVMKGITDAVGETGYLPPKGLLSDMMAAEKSAGGWEKNFIPMLKDRKYDSVHYPHSVNPHMEPDYNSFMALDTKQVTPRLSPKGQELIRARGILEPHKKLHNLDDVHYWNELPESDKVWYDAPSKPKPSSKGTTMTWNPNIPNEQALVEGLLSKLKSGELDMAGYLKEHGKIFGLE